MVSSPRNISRRTSEQDAAQEGADAIGRELRLAENEAIPPSFYFCNADDRAEYKRLLKAGEELQPDFVKKQGLEDSVMYGIYKKSNEFENADVARTLSAKYEGLCSDEDVSHDVKYSARSQPPETIAQHDRSVVLWTILVTALVLFAVFSIVIAILLDKITALKKSGVSAPS